MAVTARTGGQVLVDQLRIHGADTRLRRARRELSRRARRALRRARRDPLHHLPPGRRRGQHGRGLRQAHRQARHLLRHARSGRDQRQSIGVHTGVPGFDADDPVHRPGRRATSSSARPSRKSTTAACSARWPSGWRRSSDADRIPELVSHAFHVAMSGRPGPGGAGAARGHADRRRSTVRRRRPLPASSQAHPGAARHGRRCARCSPRPSGRS